MAKKSKILIIAFITTLVYPTNGVAVFQHRVSAPAVLIHHVAPLATLCAHYQELLMDSEWAFPGSEVKIEQGEDGVLGRGSYGEVRVATWKGLR